MFARIAWHEWGHALSVVRASSDDIRAGQRLLGLAPDGVQMAIRQGRYGRPEWLVEELYDFVRVSGWSP